MSILVVDDSENQRLLLKHLLAKQGAPDVIPAASTREAFNILGLYNPKRGKKIDLILMDIQMPEMNGIEATIQIKSVDHLKDIPIIMVTGMTDQENLQLAFAAGAMDYIVKPVQKIDLQVRVNSLLKLKHEIDERKNREQELKDVTDKLREANRELERLANLDGLTLLANRRHFDDHLKREWKRLIRVQAPLSLIMCDVDFFKLYNDTYGHQSGDDCLCAIARTIAKCLRRSADLVARYGGEEFAAIMPNTNAEGALFLAETIREETLRLKIVHDSSAISRYVTLSLGVSTTIPSEDYSPEALVESADQALYKAKHNGRDCVAMKEFDPTLGSSFNVEKSDHQEIENG